MPQSDRDIKGNMAKELFRKVWEDLGTATRN
jgi:hypothetical protein